jgi:iodotyrosine deiodinase
MDSFIPLNFVPKPIDQIKAAADENYELFKSRRSVREISSAEVPKCIIEKLILTAGTAPSGANKQPWTFCAVSNPDIKKQIREAAEKEEYESYHHRMGEEWLKDLAHLGTDWHKPFLEEAPWLIIVFRKAYDLKDGVKSNTYYSQESVGIVCGFLIQAIHQAGLVTLTHTPSPMQFLSEILKRPSNERPYLVLPVGYPKEEVKVPNLTKKTLDEVAVFYE